MTANRNPGRDRELTRDVFRRAQGAQGAEVPDVARLVRAVPAILADAARLRRRHEDPSSRIVAAAWAWLPRFALATALLAVAALVWPSASLRDGGGDDARVLDAWLMTGTVSSSVADPALDAILREDPR